MLPSLCGQCRLLEGAGQLPPAAKQGEAMNQAILPLAITMMAGPQIMSAIIFVIASKPVKVSASFIALIVL